MSKFNSMIMDIESMMEQGKNFIQIAQELKIPVRVVIEASEVIESIEDMYSQEDCSPYAKINS